MDKEKRKKPPACDRCKAKRVLCHPSPTGCPRCLEKGVECTTTPVVRRKPRRPAAMASSETPAPLGTTHRRESDNPASLSTPATPSAGHGTFLLPIPPPAGPVASTSQHQIVPAVTDVVIIPQPGIRLTPVLAEHLFTSFEQTHLFDHPVVRTLTIGKTLEALGWDVDLLPLPQRAFAYAACAVSMTVAYSPLVVGELGIPFSAFKDLNQAGPDLRAFGRRRAPACHAMREQAIRLAKEADALTLPTRENASTCLMINSLEADGDHQSMSRPWLAAYLSHIRSLPELWPEKSEILDTTLWSSFLLADSLMVGHAGSAPLTQMDVKLFVLSDPPDIEAYDRALKDTLKQKYDKDLWPDLKPFALLSLQATRELTEDILGPHARRAPLDEQALLRHFAKLEHLRSIAQSYTVLVDHTREELPPYHFDRNLVRNVRFTRGAALRSIRGFGVLTWTMLVMPLYNELQRRSQANYHDRAASLDSDDTHVRHAAERLETHLKQARSLALVGVELLADLLRRGQSLICWTHLRRSLLPEYAHFLLDGISAGTVPLNDKTAFAAEQLANGLKLVGYVYASPANDELIVQLEHRAQQHALSKQQQQQQALSLEPTQFLTDMAPQLGVSQAPQLGVSQALQLHEPLQIDAALPTTYEDLLSTLPTAFNSPALTGQADSIPVTMPSGGGGLSSVGEDASLTVDAIWTQMQTGEHFPAWAW